MTLNTAMSLLNTILGHNVMLTLCNGALNIKLYIMLYKKKENEHNGKKHNVTRGSACNVYTYNGKFLLSLLTLNKYKQILQKESLND